MGLGVGEPPVRPDLDEGMKQRRLVLARLRDVLQEELDGLPHVLPQHARQVGLALAGLLDGGEQPRAALPVGPERLGRQQLPEAEQLLGPLAVVEPAVRLPLGPRLEVEPGVDQAELEAVGHQPEPVARPPQQLQEAGVDRPAPPPPELGEVSAITNSAGTLPPGSAKITRSGRSVCEPEPIRTEAVYFVGTGCPARWAAPPGRRSVQQGVGPGQDHVRLQLAVAAVPHPGLEPRVGVAEPLGDVERRPRRGRAVGPVLVQQDDRGEQQSLVPQPGPPGVDRIVLAHGRTSSTLAGTTYSTARGRTRTSRTSNRRGRSDFSR